MPLPFFRTAEQDWLKVAAGQPVDQLDVAVLPPGFQGPAASRAGIESNDRSVQIGAEPRQVSLPKATLFVREREHIPLRRLRRADDLRHDILIGSPALALQV